MSVGNRLTGFLLLGVLVVTGLDLYWSLIRTRARLIADLQREVAAISRTLMPKEHKGVKSLGVLFLGGLNPFKEGHS